MNNNKIILEIKEELDKLKNIDNDIVKEVYDKLSDCVTKFVPEAEEKVEEDKKEEETAEEETEEKIETETETEEKVEEKEEEVEEKTDTEKIETETETETEKTEDEPEVVEVKEQELSKEVAKKLNESAIELQKMGKDIQAKEEVIEGYKAKVFELSAEVDKYKQAEALELKKKYDAKVTTLLELYKNLGIQKERPAIEQFSEEHIDAIIIDLSALTSKPNIGAKGIRKTSASTIELNNNRPAPKAVHKAADSARVLFGIEKEEIKR